MSTSAAIRRDMKDCLVFAQGERWTVKLDVRDLRGHLDTTYIAWGCTLAARVLAVLRVVWLVSALPLGYRGRLRILRTMYVPALHGVEASHLSQGSLFNLRAAFVRACWSSKLTLAHTGTVLGMLDGPEFVDPVACIVWFRFRLMRRYLDYRPLETARIGGLLELVSGGAPGHRPVHLLVESASCLGFQWCLGGFCWNSPGLPQLPMVEGPYQHFQDSILGALRDLNAADLCRRQGFRGGPLLDFRGSMQLLDSSHVRGIRLDGRVAFFGMVGYLLCLELRMVILGLLMLGMLLLSVWRLLLALMLGLTMSLVVSFHWLMVMSHLLMLLMSGLMGVWFWMFFFLASVLLGVVFMPMNLVLLGLADNGGTWICFTHCLMVLVRLVGCIVLFLALRRLCSGLRFGEF